MPVKARPNLFTFYTQGAATMPSGSDLTSKGIIYINGVSPRINPDRVNSGSTAFILRTFRDDNIICVCMTGHQVSDLVGGRTMTVPMAIPIGNNVSMNYRGEDNTIEDVDYVNVVSRSTAFLPYGVLAGLAFDESNGKDAALLLINKRMLPLTDFAALGYDFSADNAQTGGSYYSLSHPWNYPMRLSDNGTYASGDNDCMDVSFSQPYGMGDGSSGGPVFRRPSSASDLSPVKGIVSLAREPISSYWEFTAGALQVAHLYSTRERISRMSLLEPAIKEHCWKNADKNALMQSGAYKQTVMVSNPKPELTVNQIINAATDVSGSSAASTETTSDGKKVTYFMANNCTVGSFTMPTTYPGTATTWQVVVSAKQIDVNAGFNYSASGSSELDLTTVSSYSVSATSRLDGASDNSSSTSPEAGFDTAAGFKLYPNPSSDGIFYLELPAGKQTITYRGSVFSVDGKLVQQLGDMPGGGKINFSLSQQPRGIYILNVQTAEGNNVFITRITLQ
ncbi:hypothetical protein GCM10023092_27050 [Rurimicrobium arvi]|uniref:Secretion system C-terminal sorting domain-containing protein n=2 Tax=Rurimicrobium arvi TaxID=2049916 RepID=A0ABP8N2S3_9BACT